MNITTGKIPGAQKLLVYGPEGIGKTTLASQFPDPLFIDTEGSTKHMDVKRLDRPTSWTMLLAQVAWVKANPGNCATLVIDTADWAEQLCIEHVCAKGQVSGIEDFGYGKGYTYLAEEFGRLLNALTGVVDSGVHVVFTAHAQITKFELPEESGAFDRWGLKLQKKTAPLLREWCDMVLFANYKMLAIKNEDGKVKGHGGKRVMYAAHRPTFDAKNRHGLPDELEFDYAAVAGAIEGSTAHEEACAPPLEARQGSNAPEPEKPATANAKPATEVPKHLTKLFDLMASNGVDEIDVRRAVGAKGYFPKDMPIEDYPADFVEGALVAAWPKVVEMIAKSKKKPGEAPQKPAPADDEIPF